MCKYFTFFEKISEELLPNTNFQPLQIRRKLAVFNFHKSHVFPQISIKFQFQ